jgi:hypothetical protein
MLLEFCAILFSEKHKTCWLNLIIKNVKLENISFKEFRASNAHPGWHPITSNAHHFHTILTKDFDKFLVS